MIDRFLLEDRIENEQDAMSRSLQGALQRNSTYVQGLTESARKELRVEWARLLREVSRRYVQHAGPMSEAQHCDAIETIAKSMSLKFGPYLRDGRLRFGPSQKALNLYLK